MQQEDTTAKTASRELTNTSVKPRARCGMRPSQHPRQGLGIKALATKGGNLTPEEHFACLELPSAVRAGKVKLALAERKQSRTGAKPSISDSWKINLWHRAVAGL